MGVDRAAEGFSSPASTRASIQIGDHWCCARSAMRLTSSCFGVGLD